MSDDSSGSMEYISQKLNVFQVIQLYLINDIYENHEGIYSILYNIINDIKLTINLKELNQNLNGFKPRPDDLVEIIFSKLNDLKEDIREKNSKNSKFRNKYLESIESSSAESGSGSPPKLKSYRLSKSSLKPKPQITNKEDKETFDIFNIRKRKRSPSPHSKGPSISPKDFFDGKIPRVRKSSHSTEDSVNSGTLFHGTKERLEEENEMNISEVIYDPWPEKDELTSTPASKKIKSEMPPRSSTSRKNSNPKKITPNSLLRKRKKKTTNLSSSLRRSPRKHTGSTTPQKAGNTSSDLSIIDGGVIDGSPSTKPLGLLSSERRAKAEMNKSRRKLELEEPDMVEIGKDIMDSEDTDPEDDVPLANLQPVLANTSLIKQETPEPSKKLKKKKDEPVTITSIIKPPSQINKRTRRSPIKSPQGINERYRTTALTIASMFNPDYVPPSADDEIMPPLSPTKTPKKIRKSIEPRSLSTSLNEAGDLIPPLEAIQHETLAVPLPVSSDELENDEEAQELLRQAEEKKRARLLTTPKKKMSRSRLSSPRKTPRKTPSKSSPTKKIMKTPVKSPRKTPKKAAPPLRMSPRKSPRKTSQMNSSVDENKNEKKKKKKRKKKLNLRALAAAGKPKVPSTGRKSSEDSPQEIPLSEDVPPVLNIMDEPDLSVEGPVEYVATSTISHPTIHIEPPSVPEPVSTGLSEIENSPEKIRNSPKKTNLPLSPKKSSHPIIDSNAETESATESEDESNERSTKKRTNPKVTKNIRASRRAAAKTEVVADKNQNEGSSRKSSRVSARNIQTKAEPKTTKKSTKTMPPGRRKSARTK